MDQSLPLGACSPSVQTELAQWPGDYESLDQGRLWVAREYLSLFESLGWRRFEDVFATTRAQHMRTIEQRENNRLELPDPSRGSMVTAFMKRHTVSDFSGWLTTKCWGRPLHTDGMAEADAVAKAQAAGINPMVVIAAGESRGLRPWQSRSFFISEAIPAALPADEFWSQYITDSERGKALLDAMADTARKLHKAGLFHRDLYWCHFFVREAVPGCFHVSLIDLQRLIHRPPWCCAYARLKDLAQCYRSSPPAEAGGPSPAQLRDWFAHYRGRSTLAGCDRLRFALIRLRTALYRLVDGER